MTTATAPGTGPGPSLKDIEREPGLAPESLVKGERLHVASTDRTANDIVDGAGAKDVWAVKVPVILVRADDSEAAITKVLNAFGIAFDVKGEVTATNATPSDLGAK